MKKKRDVCGEILARGWDTESTSSDKYMASRGPLKTEWKNSWLEVLAEITELERTHPKYE